MTVAPPIVVLGELVAYQAGDAQILIDQATASVRTYCGWHITPVVTETVTVPGLGQTFTATRTKVLFLPSLHVVLVTSVLRDGVLVPAAEYAVDPAGLLVHVSAWSPSVASVAVTMTHGYVEAPDVAAVIMARVSRVQSTPGSAVRVQAGPFSEQYQSGTGFTDDELVTLDRYRLRPSP